MALALKPPAPPKPMSPGKPSGPLGSLAISTGTPAPQPMKVALDSGAALRWLLGGLLVGGSTRAGVSLAHTLGTAPSVKLRKNTDLYDPAVDIPVDMTPEQLARYEELQAPQAQAKAAAWNSTVNTVAGVAGGMAGWNLVDTMVKRRRRAKLDAELEGLHAELAAMSTQIPAELDPSLAGTAKAAAAWDFLEIAAQRYVDHHKDPEIAVLRKTAAGVLDRLGALGTQAVDKAKGLGTAAMGVDPLTQLLIGGGAAIGAAPFVPGIRNTLESAGEGITGAVQGLGKAVAKPVGHGIAQILGPIAALSLGYGATRGFSATAERDKRIQDLKAMREQIRKQEIAEQPYFRLKPRTAPSKDKK